MPISMEQHMAFLKAAASYRTALNKHLERLEQDLQSARKGVLTTSLPQYISDIRFDVAQSIQLLGNEHGPEIDTALRYYTPARLRINEKSKNRQRVQRTGTTTITPRPTILDEPIPPEVINDDEEPLSPQTQKELEELKKQMGILWPNTPQDIARAC